MNDPLDHAEHLTEHWAAATARRLRELSLRGLSPRHLQWAAARLGFHAYIGISILTLGLFGYLTGPLMTWYFYGDWRVWRHFHSAKGLFPHGYRMLYHVLRGDNGGFMLSVPLTAPPATKVDLSRTHLRPTWEFGYSCGPCARCCVKHDCPVLDKESGLCRGYNSFFWRYFNCGRYPTLQSEIDYYACPKWDVSESPRKARAARTKDSRVA